MKTDEDQLIRDMVDDARRIYSKLTVLDVADDISSFLSILASNDPICSSSPPGANPPLSAQSKGAKRKGDFQEE